MTRLVRWLVIRASDGGMVPVAGLAGNSFGFAVLGNLLLELIDDVFQLLSAAQWVFVGFCHVAFHWLVGPANPAAGSPPLSHTRSCDR